MGVAAVNKPPQEPEQVDFSFDSAELIIGEIHWLMKRLQDIDPNSLMRLEKLYARMRVETLVERAFH